MRMRHHKLYCTTQTVCRRENKSVNKSCKFKIYFLQQTTRQEYIVYLFQYMEIPHIYYRHAYTHTITQLYGHIYTHMNTKFSPVNYLNIISTTTTTSIKENNLCIFQSKTRRTKYTTHTINLNSLSLQNSNIYVHFLFPFH